MHIGMVGARLAWALVPLLLLALVPWLEEDRRLPGARCSGRRARSLSVHPAMLPTAVVLIALVRRRAPAADEAPGDGARRSWPSPRRSRRSGPWPLLLRRRARARLAWGEPPGIGRLGWLLVIRRSSDSGVRADRLRVSWRTFHG